MDNDTINPGSDEFISTLQDKLISGAEAVSSADSGIQRAIQGAMRSTKEATRAETERIRLEAGRFKGNILDEAEFAVQDMAESRTGFATQMTGLRKLTETTDKRLNDIEQRKQELILQNNAAGAARLSDLQVQMLEFEQEAMQNTFNNLLSVAGFGLQAEQLREGRRQFQLSYEQEGERFQLEKDKQSFAERQAMANIGLEFGIGVDPTDTIDTMVQKAAATGQVDERRQLELERLRADIKNSNAQAARAMKLSADEQAFDDVTAEILARAYRGGQTEFLAGLKTNEQLSSVIAKANELAGIDEAALNKIAEVATSKEQFLSTVNRLGGGRTPAEKAVLNAQAAAIAEATTFEQTGAIEGGMEELRTRLADAGFDSRAFIESLGEPVPFPGQ